MILADMVKFPIQDPIEERGNGVFFRGRFYPYQKVLLYSGSDTKTPNANCFLYLKDALFGIRTVAGDVGTVCTLTANFINSGALYGVSSVYCVPSTAQYVNQYVPLSLACYPGKAITSTGPDLTAYVIYVTYAEISVIA